MYISREVFVRGVRDSVENSRPYATGKLGVSEKQWLYYPLFLSDAPTPLQKAAFLANLRFHALRQSGIFPAESSFLLEFHEFYLGWLKSLDCVGAFGHPIEASLFPRLGLTQPLVKFRDQEPDRSIPANDENCFLPALRDKKVLLINCFAELLRQRASKDTFEAVWEKTGKQWFYPKSVQSLTVPYGFDLRTWQQFDTSIALFDSLSESLERLDFDVALIGAGGLGIPLAAKVKSMGKVGISMGGVLQVVFGVAGKRWLGRKNWSEKYITAAWTEVPDQFQPDETNEDKLPDSGAYW